MPPRRDLPPLNALRAFEAFGRHGKMIIAADELFVTGTMGGLTPVLALDGRAIGAGKPGPVTSQLTDLFAGLTASSGTEVC